MKRAKIKPVVEEIDEDAKLLWICQTDRPCPLVLVRLERHRLFNHLVIELNVPI